jgi:hypothetical protein
MKKFFYVVKIELAPTIVLVPRESDNKICHLRRRPFVRQCE